MRIAFVLLILVAILISSDASNAVSGSVFKLQPTLDDVQFGGTDEVDFNKGRSLRTQAKSKQGANENDEERISVAGLYFQLPMKQLRKSCKIYGRQRHHFY
ncbi:RxLR effector protein [Phytophthora megakarya]|uniref:RxLR effector protein n=1 Tax=Phytophthora megakarya TaxID=4795 RepID=A0A225VM09_9STRA|nr:RxLR effector protein [Phytophthora megakarya]